MNAPQDFTLNLTRFIRAPREKVFDAFVDEAALSRWHCPRGMSVQSAVVDARVDGAWRIEMRTQGNANHSVGGRYREIKRAERLVYTWVWEQSVEGLAGMQTLIEIDFVARDGGTEIQMRHSGFPAEAARNGHGQGWNSVFNRLTDLLDERGTAASLILLGEAASSYVRSARIGLAEKGLAYTFQRAMPHSPEIDAIHPFGKMPAFRDGTTELWETSAILRYIDEGFDGPSLNPGMVVDRARTETWVSAVGAYIYDAMVRRYVLQYVFPRGEGGTPDRVVIAKAATDMVRPLDALEHCLQGRDFIGGAAPSYADILVTPILDYLGRFPEGGQLLSDRPNIRRVLDNMRARPSFAAATAPHDAASATR